MKKKNIYVCVYVSAKWWSDVAWHLVQQKKILKREMKKTSFLKNLNICRGLLRVKFREREKLESMFDFAYFPFRLLLEEMFITQYVHKKITCCWLVRCVGLILLSSFYQLDEDDFNIVLRWNAMHKYFNINSAFVARWFTVLIIQNDYWQLETYGFSIELSSSRTQSIEIAQFSSLIIFWCARHVFLLM